MLLEELGRNLTPGQTTTSVHSVNEVPVIQTVGSCLAPHTECSGSYTDRNGTVLVRCACKCHEVVGAVALE